MNRLLNNAADLMLTVAGANFAGLASAWKNEADVPAILRESLTRLESEWSMAMEAKLAAINAPEDMP